MIEVSQHGAEPWRSGMQATSPGPVPQGYGYEHENGTLSVHCWENCVHWDRAEVFLREAVDDGRGGTKKGELRSL